MSNRRWIFSISGFCLRNLLYCQKISTPEILQIFNAHIEKGRQMAAFVLSYAYTEKGLCPYRFYFCIIEVSQGRCPRTPMSFLKKAQPKTL